MNKLDEDKIHLLLVDDEEGFRTAIAKRLTKRGLQPVQASSGEECLQLLEEMPMDVVVLDVKMPGISGITTLRSIKQAYEKTQVILLTGNVAVTDGIEGIKSGAFDYLTKPVEIDHLVNKIRQAFGIKKLKEEQQKALEYQAKLEKKMVDTERLVSLGTMSTGIAHEINNPLAIINESAGFIKQVLNSSEMLEIPRRDALIMGIEKIEKSIKRAGRITHQLLGHVRKQDSRFTSINMTTLLQETLGLLKNEINNKGIKINWKLDQEEIIFRSDPYQIRQVLINLLSNAVHASQQNGFITLSTSSTGQNHDTIMLEIQDNGTGIPKENLGKIFDPFFTTKAFDQGTGLGLFVVHKIVATLGGEVDVDSTLGQGTSFIIKLPKNFNQEETASFICAQK